MTNFQSIAGGMIWSAVALTLMLAAFEPVALNQAPGQQAVFAAAPQPGAAA